MQPRVAFHFDFGIPADQAPVSGMALGFADHSKIENTLVSEREALANVAHFRGFD